ncbi:MAG TPA: hypothetical protein VMT16_17125 [Thermoanaerobaculia bacterium]|nr:hypothetical protein [Thermoanaerobaculia bacterium]
MTPLSEILALPASAERTAALAEWLQGLYASDPPVLVAGAAVELYTGGAYTTGDLDFVGTVTPAVARALEREGFRRAGRHWVHEEGQVFVEFPAAALDEEVRAVELRVAGHRVLALAPEPLVVDRLAAWQHWGSAEDGVNAWLVARAAALDEEELHGLAARGQVDEALARLLEARRRWESENPSAEELEAWAQAIPGR